MDDRCAYSGCETKVTFVVVVHGPAMSCGHHLGQVIEHEAERHDLTGAYVTAVRLEEGS